jgi:hypothetical protein
MNTSAVGKFQVLRVLNEFDNHLIELFGRNMTDARITRYEALAVIESMQEVRSAAASLGLHKGWMPLSQVA